MELDDTPAPTSRLDHLAELATSPTHATIHSSSQSQQQQQHPYHHSPLHSQPASSAAAYKKESRSHRQHPLEPESGAWSRTPITPTTTRKFNKMAIHEVLDGNTGGSNYGHSRDHGDVPSSPAFKRKGSPDESLSDHGSSTR
ncbi:hypothetical protein BGW38_007227 [Lunasporangiospora selenospora]|uniref:Uncharacterized protein n=1 Tax=Lunasporangiospora selenospora TaxID=979761 RepID=A0A9P6FLB5_9FUNG|nr:hypothetical protein BGW38_007227 [Lunasporangiospora selenospora]